MPKEVDLSHNTLPGNVDPFFLEIWDSFILYFDSKIRDSNLYMFLIVLPSICFHVAV